MNTNKNTMKPSAEQKLTDLYVANMDLIGEGSSVAQNLRRREYIEAFKINGLPLADSDKYRLSDPARYFGRDWEYFFTPQGEVCAAECGMRGQGIAIEVNNGFYAGPQPLEVTAEGVVYGSLRAAFNDYEKVIESHYNSLVDNKNDALAALSSAFTQDGFFLYLPAGVKAAQQVTVHCRYSASEPAAYSGRGLVVVEAGAEVSVVVEQSVGCGPVPAELLLNSVGEMYVGEGARVHLTEIYRAGNRSAAFLQNYIRLEGESRLEHVVLGLGGEMMRLDCRVTLGAPDGDYSLAGLYLIGDRERCEIHAGVDHLMERCKSDVRVKGVAAGQAVGSFTGRVFVAEGAQKTDAFQQNRNLLIGNQSQIYTQPQLEIYADDVKCSHGATVGQLNEEAIYYMRQRGVSEADARRLQLQGFVNDVVARCGCEVCCACLERLAFEKIETFGA